MVAAPYRERVYSARDGRRLYFRDYGDPLSPGTPVLCLSGFARNAKDFDVLARRLSGARRIVCPDYRGRGRSERDPDWRNYGAKVVADDIVQLLALTNLHRVAIIGISYGGLLAMALSVMAPMALAGAVIDDAGPDLDAAGRTRILSYVGRDHPQADWDAALTFVQKTFPKLSYAREADWRRHAEATFREGPDGRLHVDWDPAIARHLEKRSNNVDLWPLFRALATRPTLVVRGGESDILSAETLARMSAEAPGTATVSLPGVGHAPSLNEPESERAIDDLLSRIDG